MKGILKVASGHLFAHGTDLGPDGVTGVPDVGGALRVKKTVYIETTVFSFYYDERPDSARRKKLTRTWWKTERRRHNVFTSYFAAQEAAVPRYPGWQKVSSLARRQAMLPIADEIAGIIKAYLDHQVMPADDAGDAAHLAVASYHQIDYLLTWNCAHLANANKFAHIREINRRLGLVTPEIVTPEQLFEER